MNNRERFLLVIGLLGLVLIPYGFYKEEYFAFWFGVFCLGGLVVFRVLFSNDKFANWLNKKFNIR